jgi:hypothetical protein
MMMTMFFVCLLLREWKRYTVPTLIASFTVNGSALHSFSWYWNFIIFLLCAHFPIGGGKKKQPENKIVYIFINEEIYILCLLMNSFSCDIKNVFLCLQLHIQTLSVSTMDNVRYVSSKSEQKSSFFSVKMVLWCAFNTICVSDLTFLLHFYGACLHCVYHRTTNFYRSSCSVLYLSTKIYPPAHKKSI